MVVGGGGGVESKFSVQLRPKLNNKNNLIGFDTIEIKLVCIEKRPYLVFYSPF